MQSWNFKICYMKELIFGAEMAPCPYAMTWLRSISLTWDNDQSGNSGCLSLSCLLWKIWESSLGIIDEHAIPSHVMVPDVRVALFVISRAHQAPVPLTVFRSNLTFDQNLECSSLKYVLPITTKFCTRHDSVTVVTCAKFHCDRLSIFQTRALQILVEFQIRSKYR